MTIKSKRQTLESSRRTFLLAGSTGLAWLSGCLPSRVSANEQIGEGRYGNGEGEYESDDSQYEDNNGYSDNDEYETYSTIADERQTYQVSIPDEWGEIEYFENNGKSGLVCAPNIEMFATTWEVPGVEMWVSMTDGRSLDDIIQSESWDEYCQEGGQLEITDWVSDDNHTRVERTYGYCGAFSAEFTHVAQMPSDESFVVFFSFSILSDRDHEAAEYIVDSFELISSY
jgi:hypothetical protein